VKDRIELPPRLPRIGTARDATRKSLCQDGRVNLPVLSTRRFDRVVAPIRAADSFAIDQILAQSAPVAYPLH